MIFSAYCLSYGSWTVIPDHWKVSFNEMKEGGFDAVDLTFSESELRYSMRTFEMQIKIAHECGLKVFVIPSRIGGRFAGSPLMPGLWLSQNPAFACPEEPLLACLESEEYRKWSETFLRSIFENFEVDGVIWDEPKGASQITRHPATLARYGENPTRENMMDSLLEYLEESTALVRKIRPDLKVTIFNMPGTDPYFTSRCPRIPGVDFCGFDGTCSFQSYFHEEAHFTKPTVRDTWQRTLAETSGSSCGTFALIENMLMPVSVQNSFEEELEKTLQEVRADHLSCYFYGHNNEDPNLVQKRTMEIIGKYLPSLRKS